jgi:hypothetical protein
MWAYDDPYMSLSSRLGHILCVCILNYLNENNGNLYILEEILCIYKVVVSLSLVVCEYKLHI